MVVIGVCRGERMEKVRAGGEYGYGRIGQEGVSKGLCGGGMGCVGRRTFVVGVGVLGVGLGKGRS